jgi:TatD DNase family protein
MIDAHNHIQDERLAPYRDECVAEMRRLGVKRWAVNGTGESDWAAVGELAEDFSEETIPCFGLHPWFIQDRSEDWESTLGEILDRFPQAGIGEIGLDKWIRDHRIDEQELLFRQQLKIAAERNRPVMIHCLKAWGRMLEVLRDEPLPDRGFLLHSFAGPAEMIESFVELGGYFSFSGHFIHGRKAVVREAFKRVPLDRLLIETDAPDMNLPESLDRYQLGTKEGERINHPGNIEAIYDFVSEMLEIGRNTLDVQIDENFGRLFGLAAG